jgi:hypothetical protein
MTDSTTVLLRTVSDLILDYMKRNSFELDNTEYTPLQCEDFFYEALDEIVNWVGVLERKPDYWVFSVLLRTALDSIDWYKVSIVVNAGRILLKFN